MNIEKRIRELLEEERDNPLQWWYLSYSGEDQFNGGVIVEARGFASAVLLAGTLGWSPGGQVLGVPIPPEEVPPKQYRHKLLSLAELNEFWKMESLGEPGK